MSGQRADEIPVRVSEIEEVADRVRRFRLEPVSGRLPSFSGGAHVTVTFEVDGRRVRNPYSLVGDLGPHGEPEAYEITVLRTAGSRGGSEHLHTAVGPGTELLVSPPGNLFPLHNLARRHLLVAGGIGITPFVAMTAQLARHGHDFQLHHAVRTSTSAPYSEQLRKRYGDRVRVHRSAEGQRLDIDALLVDQPLGTHLYVCGPESMIDDVLERGRRAGWPEESLHCERFVSPPGGEPFTAHLARAGLDVRVGEHESLLEAVETAGVEPPYLCRGGACGQCETRVLCADGVLDHHDHYLDDEQRASGQKLMICMSRFRGERLVLDL